MTRIIIVTTLFVFLISSLALLPLQLKAELQNCDGVWTTGSCDRLSQSPSAESVSVSEGRAAGQAEVGLLLVRKRDALHEFLTRYARVREHSAARISTAQITDVCLRVQSSFLECQQEIEMASNKLDRALLLERRIEKSKEDPAVPPSETTNVIVIQPEPRERFLYIDRQRPSSLRLPDKEDIKRKSGLPVRRKTQGDSKDGASSKSATKAVIDRGQ